MNLEYCKELIVLADFLNFGKAADKLYITQSTLSKHVAAAEKEAGFRIFDRSTSHVVLTEGGKVFIERLKEMVATYDLGVYQGKSKQDSAPTQIRIVGPLLNGSLMAYIIEACAKLQKSEYVAQTLLSDTGVRDTCDRIRAHQADIAIAFRYNEPDEGVFRRHLCDIPFGIVCRKSHRLAQIEHLTFNDIIGEKIISYPLSDRSSYHSFVNQVCMKHNIEPSIQHLDDQYLCFPDDEDLIIFGIYFPGYSHYGDDFVVRALSDDSDVFQVDVIRRIEEESAARQAFFDAIVEAANAPNA